MSARAEINFEGGEVGLEQIGTGDVRMAFRAEQSQFNVPLSVVGIRQMRNLLDQAELLLKPPVGNA